MKYLFVHQNFPAQFLHLLRDLRGQGGNEIIFISESGTSHMAGVRRVSYRLPPAPELAAPGPVAELARAMQRAAAVAQAARTLRDLGYVPDIIIGHHGWGEMLDLPDVYPGVPLLGYYEFFYHPTGLDVGFDPEFPPPVDVAPLIRARNTLNLLALALPGWGHTPTRFQHATYPDWARPRLTLLPEGVDLQECAPDPQARLRPFTLGNAVVQPGEKLVTYVARDLEPYRGFHVFMRALPHILRARPDVRVVLVGGDGVSYGAPALGGQTWRQHMLAELGGVLDMRRVHFAGRVKYDDFRRLLQRSDAHVYLTYPFVASWSLREAMACGCAIVGSQTAPVEEFLQDGRTARLVPFLAPRRIAQGVVELLEDERLATRLRANVRAHAVKTLAMQDYMAGYHRLIGELTHGGSRLTNAA
ncbi:glycosyl transferase [Komagataeibacter nataicola]|uniref:Glycosyl transferase n=1 Tax=Komagataeibacter nataicola TaxID=265960 RepID=A0A9N7CLC2_9PROT|nr:glycosyltransferase family 4 protein [Komagataeibacter nataicola]AQU87488.1 glycosyl transferase [Komagataeibacter nataicola]PYD65979.1 glycosyl transferase [Komagataeibacter nataicola]WEQ55228.1 glycosyltransferase family 4 protein [Komagataeibacter nataicola]GBR19361.1 glycosyltransferase [Komagataeibacter nataicola NRIC 0616]